MALPSRTPKPTAPTQPFHILGATQDLITSPLRRKPLSLSLSLSLPIRPPQHLPSTAAALGRIVGPVGEGCDDGPAKLHAVRGRTVSSNWCRDASRVAHVAVSSSAYFASPVVRWRKQ